MDFSLFDYFVSLSQLYTWITQHEMRYGKVIMNYELEELWEETVMTYFNLLSCEEVERNHKNSY
jgi:hypothetical protein